MILSFVLVSCNKNGNNDDETTFVNRSCNTDEPGWGQTLGEVYFATDSTWTMTRGGITQIWSDAVHTTRCDTLPSIHWRPTFYGGDLTALNFNADCRNNFTVVGGSRIEMKGNLFTWCAVSRFQDDLCPYPWRVPTADDFFVLDTILRRGGNPGQTTLRDRYVNEWGATYAGGCGTTGTLTGQMGFGFYWSQTEASGVAFGVGLYVGSATSGTLANPQLERERFHGFSLRCVKDATE